MYLTPHDILENSLQFIATLTEEQQISLSTDSF